MFWKDLFGLHCYHNSDCFSSDSIWRFLIVIVQILNICSGNSDHKKFYHKNFDVEISTWKFSSWEPKNLLYCHRANVLIRNLNSRPARRTFFIKSRRKISKIEFNFNTRTFLGRNLDGTQLAAHNNFTFIGKYFNSITGKYGNFRRIAILHFNFLHILHNCLRETFLALAFWIVQNWILKLFLLSLFELCKIKFENSFWQHWT